MIRQDLNIVGQKPIMKTGSIKSGPTHVLQVRCLYQQKNNGLPFGKPLLHWELTNTLKRVQIKNSLK